MGRIGRAALAYFATVFLVGVLLGVAREVVVRPLVGTAAAIGIEAPAMLVASWLLARWTVQRFDVVPGERWVMGLLALALLMAAELAGSMGLRGMSPADWLAHFATLPGALSLSLFAAFGAMPMLLRK